MSFKRKMFCGVISAAILAVTTMVLIQRSKSRPFPIIPEKSDFRIQKRESSGKFILITNNQESDHLSKSHIQRVSVVYRESDTDGYKHGVRVELIPPETMAYYQFESFEDASKFVNQMLTLLE